MEMTMPRCRSHCPSGGHRPCWLLDVLVMVVVLATVYWAVGKAVPVLDSVMSRAVTAVLAAVGVAAVVLVAKLAVDRVLSLRAERRFAAIKLAARAERAAAPAALTEAARKLEAAPSVRAEAFVERDGEWEAA